MPQILDTNAAGAPLKALRTVLRNPPELAPQDSLQRFIQLSRFEPAGQLPITAGGRLVGVVAHADIVPVLSQADPAAREREMERPVADFMRPPGATLSSRMGVEEAAELFSRSGQTMLPVVDDEDRYLGAVIVSDLLAPELPVPRPARIGGMATPFGVYLTDGTVRAGVGNAALMASGLAMSLLWLLSQFLLSGALFGVSWIMKRPAPVLLPLGDDLPSLSPAMGIASVAESVLLFVLFLSLMRWTRLAGYHAAEHQTVHAIERLEPLAPGVVSRMPRAHPRCGTNLMAALVLFLTFQQALASVPALGGMVAVFVAAGATLFVWRPVGTFLQERFTTRPADSREIASGIAAGKELLERYLEEAPVRPSLARRIWCSGMLQVVAGSIPIWAIYALLQNAELIKHLAAGH